MHYSIFSCALKQDNEFVPGTLHDPTKFCFQCRGKGICIECHFTRVTALSKPSHQQSNEAGLTILTNTGGYGFHSFCEQHKFAYRVLVLFWRQNVRRPRSQANIEPNNTEKEQIVKREGVNNPRQEWVAALFDILCKESPVGVGQLTMFKLLSISYCLRRLLAQQAALHLVYMAFCTSARLTAVLLPSIIASFRLLLMLTQWLEAVIIKQCGGKPNVLLLIVQRPVCFVSKPKKQADGSFEGGDRKSVV